MESIDPDLRRLAREILIALGFHGRASADHRVAVVAMYLELWRTIWSGEEDDGGRPLPDVLGSSSAEHDALQ